jgi:N4-gp56 family major capsid protein
MAASTTTTLNDLLPTIVAEALFVANERSIMRGLVRNYTLGQGQGKTVTVPIYPRSTAAGLTEGTALTNTAISTDGATLTIAEVGLMTSVTDLAMVASSSNVVADIGRLFGEAIARKMDSDLLALANGLATTVGGVSTAATPALIFQAIAKLRSQGYDTANDCAIVLHPNVAYDVASVLTSTFAAPASMVGNDALRNGFMGLLGGVPVYQSSLVPQSTASSNATGDYANLIFHRDAFGLAIQQDIKIETQRQAALRGWDIVGSAIYGVGELYDLAGVCGIFDSSIE